MFKVIFYPRSEISMPKKPPLPNFKNVLSVTFGQKWMAKLDIFSATSSGCCPTFYGGQQ
jgi:hypothetical protein